MPIKFYSDSLQFWISAEFETEMFCDLVSLIFYTVDDDKEKPFAHHVVPVYENKEFFKEELSLLGNIDDATINTIYRYCESKINEPTPYEQWCKRICFDPEVDANDQFFKSLRCVAQDDMQEVIEFVLKDSRLLRKLRNQSTAIPALIILSPVRELFGNELKEGCDVAVDCKSGNRYGINPKFADAVLSRSHEPKKSRMA